jgi:hypothetical protein
VRADQEAEVAEQADSDLTEQGKHLRSENSAQRRRKGDVT